MQGICQPGQIATACANKCATVFPMRHPQHLLSIALRPVSGLASPDLSPSHDRSQWPIGKSTLAYRCGGSSGVRNSCSRTCFPFNSPATRRAPQSGAHSTTNISRPSKFIFKDDKPQNLQNACISRPYRLTYQHFSIYSQSMENELDALEGKLAQLIQVSGKLRAENQQLRQELAHTLSNNRQCKDKIEIARTRLKKLLGTLPENQS